MPPLQEVADNVRPVRPVRMKGHHDLPSCPLRYTPPEALALGPSRVIYSTVTLPPAAGATPSQSITVTDGPRPGVRGRAEQPAETASRTGDDDSLTHDSLRHAPLRARIRTADSNDDSQRLPQAGATHLSALGPRYRPGWPLRRRSGRSPHGEPHLKQQRRWTDSDGASQLSGDGIAHA